MSYHKTKMAEINKIIREIWKNTYRGNGRLVLFVASTVMCQLYCQLQGRLMSCVSSLVR